MLPESLAQESRATAAPVDASAGIPLTTGSVSAAGTTAEGAGLLLAIEATEVGAGDSPPLRAASDSPRRYSPLAICAIVMRSTSTSPVPAAAMPSLVAAAYDRSITRSCLNGPRSLTRTMTLRPVRTLVTRT